MFPKKGHSLPNEKTLKTGDIYIPDTGLPRKVIQVGPNTFYSDCARGTKSCLYYREVEDGFFLRENETGALEVVAMGRKYREKIEELERTI